MLRGAVCQVFAHCAYQFEREATGMKAVGPLQIGVGVSLPSMIFGSAASSSTSHIHRETIDH